MLLFLPCITFAIVFLALLGKNQAKGGLAGDWRHTFLQTCGYLSAYLVLSTELLSLGKILSKAWVVIGWSAILLVLLPWSMTHYPLLVAGIRSLRQQCRPQTFFSIGTGLGLSIIALLLLVVAVKSPPNNTDSLQYHMSRVVHWEQNGSLQHYPTAFEPQLFNPIFAEVVILNLRLLGGTDGSANLVQWFCFLGIVIGVSLVAKGLGARQLGQWLAAVFVASVPMCLLQATSTQNDLVTAFWLISALYFIILGDERELATDEALSLAISAGLGILTKGTAYPYLFPLALWFLIRQIRRKKARPFLLQSLFISLVILVLNLGYWSRNIITYGGPLGSRGWVNAMTSSLNHPTSWATNLTKYVLMNFVGPSETINGAIVQGYRALFAKIDSQAHSFQLIWGWNHEDLAGSPLHMFLAIGGIFLLVTYYRHIPLLGRKYLLIVLASLLTFMLVVHFDQYGMRYLVPFWASFAPLFGLLPSLIKRPGLTYIVTSGLILAAVPYVVFNRSRPLIAMRTQEVPEPYTIPCVLGCTSIGSVLNEPPFAILFANWTQYRTPYLEATTLVKNSGCQNVGLYIDSHDLEYTFWWLLDAPQGGVRIEILNTYPHLKRYADPLFKPCAVLCTICQDKSEVHGLSLTKDFGAVRVYAEDTDLRDIP